MFHIEGLDYVRLTYETLQDAYEGHAEAAARLARFSSYFRLATLSITGVTAALAAIAVSGGRGWELASAMAAACAFGTCGAYVAFNNQPRIYGHRASAARIWVICEKYRALLADVQAGAIDAAAINDRRNGLLHDAAAIFEQTAPDDRFTFEIARRALRGRSANLEPAARTS